MTVAATKTLHNSTGTSKGRNTREKRRVTASLLYASYAKTDISCLELKIITEPKSKFYQNRTKPVGPDQPLTTKTEHNKTVSTINERHSAVEASDGATSVRADSSIPEKYKLCGR